MVHGEPADPQSYNGPDLSLEGWTVVYDADREIHLRTIRSSLVLPIGAEIELRDPVARATVVGVRLLNIGKTAAIRIDVNVPHGYWDEG
ncbi:MAG: hypothetical protein M3Q29_15030 [Chloroflexota bacterium]|nr:hypothetical protein [Chloroflexota bacterium]